MASAVRLRNWPSWRKFRGNHARAQKLATEALAHAEPGDHALRAHALMVQARSAGFQADMDVGACTGQEALVAARQAGPENSAPACMPNFCAGWASIRRRHGDPGATVRFCEEALLVLNDDLSPAAASAYLTMATPFADRATPRPLCGTRSSQSHSSRSWIWPTGDRVASLGAVSANTVICNWGEETLRLAIDVARGSGVDTYAQMIATGDPASNLSAQNRLEEARQVAETALWIQGGETYHYEMIFCRSVLADIAIAQGRVEEADAIFSSLRPEAERRHFRILLAMIDFGLAYLALGRANNRPALWHARRSFESLDLSGPFSSISIRVHAAAVCRALAKDGKRARSYPPCCRSWISPAEIETTQIVAQKIPKRILLRTLGDFEVIVDGVCLATRCMGVRQGARPAGLPCPQSGRQRLSLEMALEALWPNRESPGKTAFHTALYRLRRVLRTPGRTRANWSWSKAVNIRWIRIASRSTQIASSMP